MQGQAGAKRASYEARWQFFTNKHTDAPIHYKDVPWILPQETASQEELQHVVLYGGYLGSWWLTGGSARLREKVTGEGASC